MANLLILNLGFTLVHTLLRLPTLFRIGFHSKVWIILWVVIVIVVVVPSWWQIWFHVLWKIHLIWMVVILGLSFGSWTVRSWLLLHQSFFLSNQMIKRLDWHIIKSGGLSVKGATLLLHFVLVILLFLIVGFVTKNSWGWLSTWSLTFVIRYRGHI